MAIDDSRQVEVINRMNGTTTYIIPEMQNLKRTFTTKERKVVPFEELRRLMYVPGGEEILREYLIIADKDVIQELGLHVEPEYFYNEEEINHLFEKGSLDEFLDCLDFAPKGVIDTIKAMAVTLPLNDVAKRQAIFDKTGFDVTKAIEIKNTKYDGGIEETTETKVSGRRAAPIKTDNATTAPSGRRYKPVTKDE